MLRAPGPNDPDLKWYLAEVNKAQRRLDDAIARARTLPVDEPERSLRIERYNALKREINQTFRSLDKSTASWSRSSIERYYTTGHAGATAMMDVGYDFTLPHKEAIEHLQRDAYEDVATGLRQARDTFNDRIEAAKVTSDIDLIRVQKNILQSTGGGALTVAQREAIQRASRGAVSQQLLTGLLDIDDTAAVIAEELWGEGIPIIDRSGRRWKMETYTRMLARTKSAQAYNAGSLGKYAEARVSHVKVFDGIDNDRECAAANGEVWTLKYAQLNVLAHPNCRRAFGPAPGALNINRHSPAERIQVAQRSIKKIQNTARAFNTGFALATAVRSWELNPGVIDIHSGYFPLDVVGFFEDRLGVEVLNADLMYQTLSRALTDLVDPALLRLGVLEPSDVPDFVRKDWDFVKDKLRRLADEYQTQEARVLAETFQPLTEGSTPIVRTRTLAQRTFPAPVIDEYKEEATDAVLDFLDNIAGAVGGSEEFAVELDLIKANVDLRVHANMGIFFESFSRAGDQATEQAARIVKAPDFGSELNRLFGIEPGRDSLWDAAQKINRWLDENPDPGAFKTLNPLLHRKVDVFRKVYSGSAETEISRFLLEVIGVDLRTIKTTKVRAFDEYTNAFQIKSFPAIGPVSVTDWETMYDVLRNIDEGASVLPEASLAEIIIRHGGDPDKDAFGAFLATIEPWKLTIKENAIWQDIDVVDSTTLPAIMGALGYDNVRQISDAYNVHGAITVVDNTAVIKVFGQRGVGPGPGSAANEAIINWAAKRMNLPSVDSVAVLRPDNGIEYKVARYIDSLPTKAGRTSTSADRVSVLEGMFGIHDMHGGNWTVATDGRIYLWDVEGALDGPQIYNAQWSPINAYLRDADGNYAVGDLVENIARRGGPDAQAGRYVFVENLDYRILVLSDAEERFVNEMLQLEPEEILELWFREGIVVGYEPDDAYLLGRATTFKSRIQQAVDNGMIVRDGQRAFDEVGGRRVNVGDFMPPSLDGQGDDLEGLIVNHFWTDSEGERWIQLYDPRPGSAIEGAPYPTMRLSELQLLDPDTARVPTPAYSMRSPFGDFRDPDLARKFNRSYDPPTLLTRETNVLGISIGEQERTMSISTEFNIEPRFKFRDGSTHQLVDHEETWQRMVVTTSEAIAPEYRPNSVTLVDGLIELPDGRRAYGLFDPETNSIRVSAQAGLVYDANGVPIGFSWDKVRMVVTHEMGHAVDDNITAVIASRLRSKLAQDLIIAVKEETGLQNPTWEEIGRYLIDTRAVDATSPDEAVRRLLDDKVDVIMQLRNESRRQLVQPLIADGTDDWIRVAQAYDPSLIDVGAELAADGFAHMMGANPTPETFGIAMAQRGFLGVRKVVEGDADAVKDFMDKASELLVGYRRVADDQRVIIKRGAQTIGEQTDPKTFILTIAEDADVDDIVRAWMEQDAFIPARMPLAPRGREAVEEVARGVMVEMAAEYRRNRDPKKLLAIAEVLKEQNPTLAEMGDNYWSWFSNEVADIMWTLGGQALEEGADRAALAAELAEEAVNVFIRDLLTADAIGNLPPASFVGGSFKVEAVTGITREGTATAQDIVSRFEFRNSYWENNIGNKLPPNLSTQDADEARSFWGMFFDPEVADVLTDTINTPYILDEWTVPSFVDSSPRWRTLPEDDQGRFTYARLQSHILDDSGRVDDELGWTGGTTIDILTEDIPKGGWSVALKEHEEIIDPEEFTPQKLREYVLSRKDALEQDGYYLGAWYDHEETGLVYLDVVRVIDDDLTAARFGVENKQLAMFDLGAGDTRNLSGTTMRDYIATYHPDLNALPTVEELDETIPALSGKLKVNGVPTDVPILAKDGKPIGIRLGDDLDEAVGYKGYSRALNSYHRLAYRTGNDYVYVPGRVSPVVDVKKSRVVDARLDAVKDRYRTVLRQAADVYDSGNVESRVGTTKGQTITRDTHRFYEIWHGDIQLNAETLDGSLGVSQDEWFTRTAAAAAAMSPGQDADVNIVIANNMAEFVSKRDEIRLNLEYADHVRARIENILSYYNPDPSKIADKKKRERVLRFLEALEALDASRGKTVSQIDNDTVRVFMGEFYARQTIGKSYESSNGIEAFYPALRVLEGDLSIHESLGASKVRSFYNNIVDPYDVLGMNDLTIDFHMTDAGLFVRGSGKVYGVEGYSSPNFETPGLLGVSLGFRAIAAQAVRELFYEVDPSTGVTWAERVDAKSVAQIQEVIWSMWREGKAYGWWGELQLVWPNPNAPAANLPNYRRLGIVKRALEPPEV